MTMLQVWVRPKTMGISSCTYLTAAMLCWDMKYFFLQLYTTNYDVILIVTLLDMLVEQLSEQEILQAIHCPKVMFNLGPCL